VTQLIGMNKTLQNALIAADRLFEIMDLEREESEEKLQLTSDLVGDIVFDHVRFSYGSRVEVFRNFSCRIQQGKMTAVIGESGSGKTTLGALIQQLYPLQEGKISIGQYDLNYISKSSLRERIAIVPQQIDLFSGNVVSNIAVGEDIPNFQRLLQVVNELDMMSFIEKLPAGFETQLGENGSMLSGGQRQRIAIARALYRNPDILILDEATSALDTSTEQVIQRAFRRFKDSGKTMIVIAHRLSTIAEADTIMVLKDGVLIEQGEHNQLLAQESAYKDMWKKQSIVLN
jgi:ATP-binding cassette subfamily B protein